jgi:hypothetical protein
MNLRELLNDNSHLPKSKSDNFPVREVGTNTGNPPISKSDSNFDYSRKG